MTVDFVIYLTHDEDHKLIYYPIYYALLTHARYIVLFCHGSTEEDQAQETDQNSDGFTINDVVDINDRHYFNIFFPWTQGIKPVSTDKVHMWVQASFYRLPRGLTAYQLAASSKNTT